AEAPAARGWPEGCDLCRVRALGCFLPLLCATAFAQEDSVAVMVPVDSTAMVTTVAPVAPGTAPEQAVPDTLDWRLRHSPTKATILSAIVPGAGQIYNHKYWKAPIAWAGLGISVWFIQDNKVQYRRYKDAYI